MNKRRISPPACRYCKTNCIMNICLYSLYTMWKLTPVIKCGSIKDSKNKKLVSKGKGEGDDLVGMSGSTQPQPVLICLLIIPLLLIP